MNRKFAIAALVLPATLVVLGFYIYPVIYSFWLSLYEVNLSTGFMERARFVGFANFGQVFGDKFFWLSAQLTFFYAVGIVALGFLWSLGLALVVNEKFRGRSVVRTAILIPWAVPSLVGGFMWSWIFSGDVGALNGALYDLGLIQEYIVWMQDYTVPSIVLASIWAATSLPTLLLLAGLQGIAQDFYESAKVDGASAFSRFRHITLPLLKPQILIVLILTSLEALRVFDLIYYLSGGRKDFFVLSYYIYRQSFAFLDFGYGTAMGWLLGMVTIALSLVYIRRLGEAI